MESSHKIPKSVSELSIVFTSDKEIRKLNFEYRGKDKATDVLSFSQLEGVKSGVGISSLGDIVISCDTAKRQAKEYGNTFQQEILRLLIHGILHLLGHDHENVSKAKAEKMRRIERKLFKENSRSNYS